MGMCTTSDDTDEDGKEPPPEDSDNHHAPWIQGLWFQLAQFHSKASISMIELKGFYLRERPA